MFEKDSQIFQIINESYFFDSFTYKFKMTMKKLLLLSFLLFCLACDPFDAIIEESDMPVVLYEASSIREQSAASDSLKVASWNIKFAGGRLDFFFDCYGERSLMETTEVNNHLEGLAAKINQMDVDILFVQEIDVNAKRSGYIDQLQYLLDATEFSYAAYASQWKSDYVPSDGIGLINSGNAILSRYPLENTERIALPLIEEQSGFIQYFYLRRNMLKAQITDAQNQAIVLINTHTSAFAKDGTKDKQLLQIKAEIDQLQTAGQSFVLGGDFNSLPPSTEQVEGFSDDVCPEDSEFSANDFSAETDIMLPFYDYEALIPLEDYAADNTPYFTFTANKDGFWNRKLDFMFTNAQFRFGLVHLDEARGGMATMPLSDHAPLSGTVFNW